MNKNALEIGRLLRSGTSGFVAGCAVSQWDVPIFGGLVRAPLGNGYQVYGLIYDIRIEDDGLVRQLVTAGNISEEVIADNRERRIVPVEISVLTVGYESEGKISYLLPPRPPLSLDVIYKCNNAEVIRFTDAGQFGYFRHILRLKDAPVSEVLAAHLHQASEARGANGEAWKNAATKEVITLLRDDYPTLMNVLGALGEI
jgi:hypothetical protein